MYYPNCTYSCPYHELKTKYRRWSVDRKAVFRFFDLLEEDSMITIKKTDGAGQR